MLIRAGTGAKKQPPSTRTLTTDPNSRNHKKKYLPLEVLETNGSETFEEKCLLFN